MYNSLTLWRAMSRHLNAVLAHVSSILLSARFATTVARIDQLPREGLREIAFVGRSNAGKSSAINTLCQRRRLAFASKTPGRTQALNFFSLGAEDRPPAAYLVDTPGYGYAATPLAVKQGWDRLAGRYLSERAELFGVVLMIDCRRQVTALDRTLLSFVPPHVHLLVLMTKSDKLGYQQREITRKAISAELGQMALSNPLTLIAFSANTGLGIEAVRQHLDAWIPLDGQKKAPVARTTGG